MSVEKERLLGLNGGEPGEHLFATSAEREVKGRFPFTKKNPEISVVAKVEFPIGKKVFHLVVNPGTWRGARPWTWNWYKLRET